MLRRIIHGGFVFVVAFLLMGPFSHAMVGKSDWLLMMGLGMGWGLALGLIVGMGSDISTGVGMVLGLGAGAGVYWGPFDGVIIGFVAAIPAAMGIGLVSILLDWSLGAGLFWGLSLGISAVLLVLLEGGWTVFAAAAAGCLSGLGIRVLLRTWSVRPAQETE